MNKPPPRLPEFARFLREKRGDRSRKAVITQMRAIGIDFSGSALHRYEVEARLPPIDVLRGVSATYQVSFEEIVDRVLRELRVKPIQWRDRLAQELPSEAIEVAAAFGEAEDHIRGVIRQLLRLTDEREHSPPQPRAAVGERPRSKKKKK